MQAAHRSQPTEQDLLDLSGESPVPPPHSEGFADVFKRQPAPVESRANDVPADLQDLYGTGPSQVAHNPYQPGGLELKETCRCARSYRG